MRKVLLMIVAIVILFASYQVMSSKLITSNQVACTLEAQLCPDGSAVGRIGPDCEFAACPSVMPVNSEDRVRICTGKTIPNLTEGPYYKTGSPQKTNLLESGIPGEKLVLTGFVFNSECEPIPGAWLDFWQADGEGIYDNSGYTLRGHQFTDEKGRYSVETVLPGVYPGRTPHIHVKVRVSAESPIITSQLFIPNEPLNQNDAIFDESLVMNVTNGSDGKIATFNFVINE